ncbi:MAG TPA: pilus assembly PilX N-terminal domain-containing protein [bacterium]|nr:pilus assembly PilX N-terminal domain-containing protein [bacterium]
MRTRNPADRLRDERGMALVSLLVILAALTVLSMGLIVFSSTEMQIADNSKNHTGALYVSEAGIAEVMTRMSERPGKTTVTVNGGTFDPAIADDLINPTPTWRTEVHLSAPGSLPAPTGTETIVATVQPNGSWLNYGDPTQGMDPITIEHKWADLNGDGVRDANEIVKYDANKFPPQNFDSGFPVEVVTVPGILNGSRRNVVTEVIRVPLAVKVTAAITCDNGVDMTGNMAGCGHNHGLFTPVGTKIPGCYPWEKCSGRTLDAVSNCLIAVKTTGDVAVTGGSSDLEGFPVWSDTSSTNTFDNVWEYLGLTQDAWDEVKSRPDYTSANDSATPDGIMIVEHDATGGEKFNGQDGYGLIYVNGDMDISGNLVWRGFIFVEGNCNITGTAWILGAICVRGVTSANAFAAGNSTILYSQDAISIYVGGRMGYQTLAWNEI